jgi:hypothetical protein
MNPNLIRNNPKFELFIDGDYLIVNNEDFKKDNCNYKLTEIIDVELTFNDNIFSKMITFLISAWELPKNSTTLRITHTNGVKEVILTNCNIKKVEEIFIILKNKLNE